MTDRVGGKRSKGRSRIIWLDNIRGRSRKIDSLGANEKQF